MSAPATVALDGAIARTVAVDEPARLLDLLPDPGAWAWVRGGEGLVAWGTAARFDPGTGPGRFAAARSRLAELAGRVEVDDGLGLPGSGLVALASFSFDDGGGSVLVVPRTVVGHREGRWWVTTVGRPGDPEVDDPTRALRDPAPVTDHGRLRYAGSSRSELAWLDAVARAIAELRAGGELAKVVLARDRTVWARRPFDPRLLLRRLAAHYPTCYAFAVDGLVGATPELLVRRAGDEATSLVLAGTAPRGDDPARDEELGARLRASAKDVVEHRYAVESVLAALEPVADEAGADPAPWLLRLANVQHLATGVRARLASPAADVLDLAARLHPTAAVCGTPTAAAREVITRLEDLDRARYAGPVGWVDAHGNGELGIALRCAEVDGTRARLFTGAGIMGASLPEAELEETRLKLRAMQSAIEG